MKKLSVVLVCLVISVLIPFPINAQSSVFERLSGSWKGNGVVSGMESAIEMKWESVLAGKFYRLSFKNDMKSKNGTIVFEGTAFYKLKTAAETEGNWFDSFGFIRPIKAKIEVDKLISNWGSQEVEEGKTIYHLIEADKLEVVDSVKTKEGTWREFGRSILSRTKD